MEAMRACANSCGTLEVEVVEFSISDGHVLSTWTNETPNCGSLDHTICIVHSRVTDNQTVFNESILVTSVLNCTKLDTSNTTISNSEVPEDDSTSTLSDSGITAHLPSDEILEDCRHLRVGPVWVIVTTRFVVAVIPCARTWVLLRNQSVENT